MEAFGVKPEDVAQQVIEVWPENMEAAVIFMDLDTQWRYGINGITGLEYSAIATPLRFRRVPRERWQDVWDGIRIMERAVLELKAEASNG
jgi:hypothetical protein